MPGKQPARVNNSENNPVMQEWLLNILQKVKSDEISLKDALSELSCLPYEQMEFANIDHHRSLRVGFPEVIFGLGKTVEQITTISVSLIALSERLLVTHATPEAFTSVKQVIGDAQYNPASRTIVVNRSSRTALRPGVAVVTGGTADLPVAEEAIVTAELMGHKVDKIVDVGVAGIHRLLDKVGRLRQANVLVVVAGMEGALPSVIGGLVAVPIIAVPTSVGYGASFNGLAPLLTMLNSCAPGVAVVNIDNGFGAGYLAGLINMSRENNDTK